MKKHFLQWVQFLPKKCNLKKTPHFAPYDEAIAKEVDEKRYNFAKKCITHADVWYFVSFAVHARVRVVNNRGVSDTSEMESESEYSQVWTTNSISSYLVFLDGNRIVAILTQALFLDDFPANFG